jgi:hypothetical protein
MDGSLESGTSMAHISDFEIEPMRAEVMVSTTNGALEETMQMGLREA